MAMGVFMMLSADYIIGTRGDLKVAANEVAIGLTLPRVASAMLGYRLDRAAFQRAAILSEYFDVESADSGGRPHSRLTIAPNLPRSTRRLERAPFRCRFTPTTNPAKAGLEMLGRWISARPMEQGHKPARNGRSSTRSHRHQAHPSSFIV